MSSQDLEWGPIPITTEGDRPCYVCEGRRWWRYKAHWICETCAPPLKHLAGVIQQKTI